MRVFLASVLLCATLAFGDQPVADQSTAEHAADRTAIETVINALKTAKPVSVLFTADADSDLAQLNAAQSAMTEAARQPWSEAMPPKLVIDSIRFVTADGVNVNVAIVNAENRQITSTMVRRTPVLLVMRREGSSWKIASLRMLTASPVF
jgi:hypothetical protein